MGKVSPGAAIGAGFRLIGREPLAFLAWSVAYLVIGILPQIWALSVILPTFGEIVQMGSSGEEPQMADIMQMQARIFQLQPVLVLTSIVSQAVLFGAIYRALLMPQDSSVFYLRLSMRELWLGLVHLSLGVLFVLGFIALMIPVGILSAVIVGMAGESASLLVPIMVLAVVVVGFWAMLRLSMAPVMSFENATFRLFDSWRLTGGSALSIFAVALALVVIIFLAQMVLVGIFVGATIGSFMSGDWAATWLEDPEAVLKSIGLPVIVVFCLAAALFSTFAYTLFGAAWAEMYRQLTEGEVPPA